MPSDVPRITVARAAKPWWLSRTLWLNATVLGLAAAEAQLGVIQPLLPVNAYALFAFVLPVANAALRFVTAQGLSKGAQPAAKTGDA